MDALLATGEMVSTALLAMALCKSGCRARSWNALQLPIETTGPAGRARIERVGCEGLKQDLAAGIVPVVAGFQGRAANGDLTTIGRGGSDTTAVALAVVLGADECQILTDVDGVYTTDPRMVPEARRLADRELRGDARARGAGVARAAPALGRVRRAPRHEAARAVEFRARPGHADLRGEPERGSPRRFRHRLQPRRGRDRRQPGAATSAGVAHALLAPVAEASIEVDMIVINAPQGGRVDLTFTVHRDDYARALELDAHAAAKLRGRRGRRRRPRRETRGRRLRHALARRASRRSCSRRSAREGINVRLVSTSEIKISVLVAEKDLERAVRALHKAYGLDRRSGCEFDIIRHI